VEISTNKQGNKDKQETGKYKSNKPFHGDENAKINKLAGPGERGDDWARNIDAAEPLGTA